MGEIKKIIGQVKRFLLQILTAFIKPCIIFESRPRFSDNTRAVFDEFLRRGYDKKYRLVWYLDDDTCASLTEGGPVYWDPRARRTLAEKLRNLSFYYKTKAIVCCNRFLPSHGWQCPVEPNICKSFYLSHGTPMKKVEAYYSAPEGIDFAFSPSENVTEIMARAFQIDRFRFLVSGYPRTDVLFRTQDSVRDRIGRGYDKVIVWLPTFRQHQKPTVHSAGGYAMPIIHNSAHAQRLNDMAKKHNVLVLFKPHFVQNRAFLEDINLSNIQIADEAFFNQSGITTYELLAASDALITDYSSVYFDYTLLDKPIAAVLEDLDEYKENPGFVIDLEKYLAGAEKVFSIEDLCSFVEEVSSGEDRLQDERKAICNLTNTYQDGRNAERTVDYIVEKAKL